MSTSQRDSGDIEKGDVPHHLDRPHTRGGHEEDTSMTPIPVQHRRFGNPAPLGLLAFGTGFFLASAFSLHTRGVAIPNVMVPVLVFYSGLMQTIVALWELLEGNTFGGTVFGSFGAFNLSYAGLYLPAFGVASAYLEADGKTLSPEFNEAVGIYLFAWLMVVILFIIGALRSNLSVLCTLSFSACAILCLGISQFNGSDGFRIAGGSFGMLASFSAYWAAMSGFWSEDVTFKFIRLDPVALRR